MKRGLDTIRENSAYKTLVAQICHEETGRKVDFREFQKKVGELKPGTKIKIYRLAQRDILRDKAGVLDVEIKSVDPQRSKFICDGQYISSNPEEGPHSITSATCTVPITSDIIVVYAEGLGRHNSILFKKQEEPVLIFVQREEGSMEESRIKAWVLKCLRGIGIDIG